MDEREEKIQYIMDMGFLRDQANQALRANNDHLERAVNYLLTDAMDTAPASPCVRPVVRAIIVLSNNFIGLSIACRPESVVTAQSSEHDDGETGSVVGTGSPLKSSVKGAGSDKPVGPVTFDHCMPDYCCFFLAT